MLQTQNNPPLVGKNAIAIGIQGKATEQKHIVLIYRLEDLKPRLLHLAWHEKLVHEYWNSSYYWVEFDGLDEEVQETLADYAVLVASSSANRKLPYSVTYEPGKYFDTSGAFIDFKEGRGLTCATFVLAICSDFSLPLVNLESWPEKRSGDYSWVRRILKFLRKYNKLHFLEQFRARHALKRFRPEEIVSIPSVFVGTPLEFNQVENMGKAVLKELQI